MNKPNELRQAILNKLGDNIMESSDDHIANAILDAVIEALPSPYRTSDIPERNGFNMCLLNVKAILTSAKGDKQ